MGGGGPEASPYQFDAVDNFGKHIRITIPFNEATGAILNGGSVVRDADCQWTKIYIGLGADGTPDTTDKVFTVPEGTTNLTANQLGSRGLDTITDLRLYQVTAGP